MRRTLLQRSATPHSKRIGYPERNGVLLRVPVLREQISMVLDTSVTGQVYVEDCEVCCQPIEVRYAVADDAVCAFEARAV